MEASAASFARSAAAGCPRHAGGHVGEPHGGVGERRFRSRVEGRREVSAAPARLLLASATGECCTASASASGRTSGCVVGATPLQLRPASATGQASAVARVGDGASERRGPRRRRGKRAPRPASATGQASAAVRVGDGESEHRVWHSVGPRQHGGGERGVRRSADPRRRNRGRRRDTRSVDSERVVGATPAAASARDGAVSRAPLRAPRLGTRAVEWWPQRLGPTAEGPREPRRAGRRPGGLPRPPPGHRGARRGGGQGRQFASRVRWRHTDTQWGALEAGKQNTALPPPIQDLDALGRPSQAVSEPAHEERGPRELASYVGAWWRLRGRGALKGAVAGSLSVAGCLESTSLRP